MLKKDASITRRPFADQYKYEKWSELWGVPWRLQVREPGQLRVDLPVVVGQPQRAPQEETVPTNLHVLKSEFWKNMGTRHCRVRSTAKDPAELQKTEEEKACIDAARARLDAGRRPKNQGGAPAAAAAANAPVLVGASEPDAEVAELGTCKSERSFEAGAPGKARRKERRKTERRHREELYQRMQEATGGEGAVTVVGPLPSARSMRRSTRACAGAIG